MTVSAINSTQTSYQNYEIKSQEAKTSSSVFMQEDDIDAKRKKWSEVAEKNIKKAQELGVADKYKLQQQIIADKKTGTIVITLDGNTNLKTVRNDLQLKSGRLYECNKNKLDNMNKKQDEYGISDMDSFVPPAGTTLVINGADLFAAENSNWFTRIFK